MLPAETPSKKEIARMRPSAEAWNMKEDTDVCRHMKSTRVRKGPTNDRII
jgi:hypothetical protein